MIDPRPQPRPETAGASVPFPPPLAYFTGMAIGFALHLVVPVHLVRSIQAKQGLVLFASGILALSAGLVIASVISFRRARTTPYFRQASSALIVRGAFRVSRNPVYLAGALLHAGLSLLANALWPLLLLVPALAIVTALIRREEGYLARQFGAEYEAYRTRVPRWI